MEWCDLGDDHDSLTGDRGGEAQMEDIFYAHHGEISDYLQRVHGKIIDTLNQSIMSIKVQESQTEQYPNQADPLQSE